MIDYDSKLFDNISEHCEDLKMDHAQRDTDAQNYENIYLLKDFDMNVEAGMEQKIMKTMSPDGRVTIQGTHRLLSVTEPDIKVPIDTSDEEVIEKSSAIEKMADTIWSAAGSIYGRPLHDDVCLSALIYGEIHIGVISTLEQVRLLEEQIENMKDDSGVSLAVLERAKWVARQTPYIFDVRNPRGGYPEWDKYGLRAFYSEYEMTAGDIIDQYGSAAREAMQKDGELNLYEARILKEFWDLRYHQVWVGDAKMPVMQDEHKLPKIPIVAALVEGSRMFDKPEYQRESFLYTLHHSGILRRQHLALTALFTNIWNFGIYPILVEQESPDGGRIGRLETGQPINRWVVPHGGNLGVLGGISQVTENFKYGWETAQQKGEESTIYRQTLGEPLGSNAPFSMVALLSQMGRLPLAMVQRMSGRAIADALKIALDWMRTDKKKYSARYKDRKMELKASEIPEFYELEVGLEVALPQDRYQQANIVNALQDKLPMRLLMEDFFQLGNYEEISDEWRNEQMVKAMFQYFAQQTIPQYFMASMQAKQKKEQGAIPGGPMGVPGEMPTFAQGGPPGAPPGVPPGVPAGRPPIVAPEEQMPGMQTPYGRREFEPPPQGAI